MLYKPNWEEIQKRYKAYWARENHDKPIVSICAPKEKKIIQELPKRNTLKERWCDVEYMLKKHNLDFQNTYFGGDAIPRLCPDLGPDFFAACYGLELEFGENTSWAIHNLHEWEEYKPFVLDKQSFYYQKMLEMTKAAVEDGKDKYLVGIADIHPAADGLVAMRSPQELCIDTIERPEFIQRGSLELFEGFKSMYDDLYALTTKYQKGSTNWMGIWHPEKWYVTSCDFCCMISPDSFEELVIEELEKELEFLDASIFHLDGPGALKHLDRLLQVEKLKGIQWVYGAGQPSASHWLDVLKKIQNSGKLIQVSVEPEELDVMLENLEPEGVMYTINTHSEEEAKDLEKKVNDYANRRKIF